MSGNLKPFVLQSSAAVAFTLEVGGSQVLNETYYPGNGNLIEIDLREVVESYLSFTFPSSDVFNQTLLVRSFTAKFDGQTVSFNAIRAGKARLNQSASEFLKENFLTWQPQVKPVTYYSPEWLTYYAVETCRIQLKAYFEDGTSSETTLSSPSAGTCYTLNLQYGVVSGKFSGKRPTYYDVWVESTGGQRLTYVQRYIGSQRRSEDENWYLFENSLGGLDSLRAYGALDDAPEYEHNVSQLDGILTEYRVDTNRKYTRNTGYLTPQESAWLQDMFSSRQKYAYTASGYYKIVFTASDGGRSSTELPSSYSFTYQFAEDLPFLDIQRREDLPDNLELKTPEGETFFLPPRLAEFPKLSLSPDLLLPAQEPHTEKWGTITAGTLKDTVLNELIEQLQGLDMDPQPSGGLDAYLIKVGDLTVPTDDNIFSAARTLQEIQKNSLWELVTKALDGSDLPEEKQYLTPLFGRNIVAPGDIIAFADGGEYASGLPVADFDTFGLFKAKREGGLLFDTNEGWYVDPEFAGGGGLDIDQLQKYLDDNGYLTLSSPLTGYAKPEAYSPIAATDTILSAIGKLERNFGNYVDLTTNQTIGGVKTFNETLLSKKDIIAYADGGEYASGLPVADTTTYGLVKVDGTTVRINASGQLEADAGGGIDFTVGTGLQLSIDSILSVKYGTTAGTACQGNDYRLSDARRNPYSLSWSGYSSGSYDGSTSKSLTIPSNTDQLTNGAGFIVDGNKNFTSLQGSGNSSQYLAGNGRFYTISHSEIDGLSSNYVTLSTTQTITGQKSYTALGWYKGIGILRAGSTSNMYIAFAEGSGNCINAYNAGTGAIGNIYLNYQATNAFTRIDPSNNLVTTGDVIAYADGGNYASGLPVADTYTYGLIKYDGTTIGKNSSGQLYVIGGSGGGSTIQVIDNLTSSSTTAALSANQGRLLDQRLQSVKFGSAYTDYVPVYLGSTSYNLSRYGHTHSQYLTSHQTIYSLKLTINGTTYTYTPNSGSKTVTINTSGSGSSWNGGTISNNITIDKSSGVAILALYGSKSDWQAAQIQLVNEYYTDYRRKWCIDLSGSSEQSGDLCFQNYNSAGSGSANQSPWYRFKIFKHGTATNGVAAAGQYVNNSDARLKNILCSYHDRAIELSGDNNSILDKIRCLNAKYYYWKVPENANDEEKLLPFYNTIQLGFIAQEVEEIFPEFVSEDNGYKLLNYVGLGSVVAVEGVKELYTRFLPVENEVTRLKNKIQYLEQKNINITERLDNAYREIFELKQQKGGAA